MVGLVLPGTGAHCFFWFCWYSGDLSKIPGHDAMKTYEKILITILPLVFIFVFIMVGTTYHFARTALTELAETWLLTRLAEAKRAAVIQVDTLKKYGLEEVPASIMKAQMDIGAAMRAIEMGKSGFVFAIGEKGRVVLHPDPEKVGVDISRQTWFQELRPEGGRLEYTDDGEPCLARYDFFEPWRWYLVASSPVKEVYGVVNRIRPYTISLGMICSLILLLVLMVLTQQLTRPLRMLTDGALRFAKGDLDTRISIQSKDEFGQLAGVFNHMAGQMQQTLTTIRTSHRKLEQGVRERTAQLEAKNRELKDFAHIVSHDLKAPLRAISQLSHWIATDYDHLLDKDGRDMIRLMGKRVRRMDSLINDILSYARIGSAVGRKERVDINTMLREVVDNMAPPVSISIVLKNQLPVIETDPVPLAHIFQNLIDNAVKFMENPRGEIRVACLDAGSHWLFCVADDGPGIKRRYHEKIFKMFQSLHTRDDMESTGIGLAQVRKNVEMLGGTIRVRSEVGQGSAFIFSLPKS
jgi:signal transduction histidine kinase